MKTSTQSILIIAGLLCVPVLLVAFILLFAQFLNIIIVIVTFTLCFFLVAYYSYIKIKEELDWVKSEDERLTYGFRHDAFKMRMYKFYKNYFNTRHEK
jgi:fatty acid desaturase